MLAAFKLRAVPINVNYRYVEDELRYLLDDADVTAVVFHREFAPKLAAIRDVAAAAAHVRRGRRRHRRADAGSLLDGDDYEAALAARSAGRDFGAALGRRPLHPLHRRHHRHAEGRDVARTRTSSSARCGGAGGGGTPITHARGDRRALPRAAHAVRSRLPVHARHRALDGVRHALHRRHRRHPGRAPARPARAVAARSRREQANFMVIVGDAFAAPLLDALDDRRGPRARRLVLHVRALGRRDPLAVAEARARRAPARRARHRRLRRVGDRRAGPVGRRRRAATIPTAPRFRVGDDTHGARRRPAAGRRPASSAGSPGAATIPLGYYKDPEKTAATFPVVDGVRWAVPGDHAVVEDDGTITLLGRGSVSINTGGEKVYPEEVESVLKAHADVFDAVVVGVPDERWGERVVAVVQPRAGATPHARRAPGARRAHLAGYKVPRDVVLVDAIARSPSGKPDYRWAKAAATPRAGYGRTRDQPPAGETSPYLRQHADNPVDWYPWGDEAFARRAPSATSRLLVGRLLVVPLVPRDGARVVRGRRHRRR